MEKKVKQGENKMKPKFLKKKIKQVRSLWDYSLDQGRVYSENFYDKEIGPKLAEPVYKLAEVIVEEILGKKLNTLKNKEGWVDGKYVPDAMVDLILYSDNKNVEKELLKMAKKIKPE